MKIEELEHQIGRIMNNPAFKATKPLRKFAHLLLRIKRKVMQYRSPKQLVGKLQSKKIEKTAMKQHGTESFPNETDRRKQEATEFSKGIIFSILVPL